MSWFLKVLVVLLFQFHLDVRVQYGVKLRFNISNRQKKKKNDSN